MNYVCHGCGKKLDTMEIRVIGPGTLKWCNDCVENGTQKRIAQELWDKYGSKGTHESTKKYLELTDDQKLNRKTEK